MGSPSLDGNVAMQGNEICLLKALYKNEGNNILTKRKNVNMMV